ncbi:MAG: hypothetical protein HOJ62_10935 [Planctomycetaceae bacterium]|nr:hypothetical protein [Planctomycetaceae bacterium]
MSRIIAILLANFFVVDYGVVPDGKEDSVYVIQIEPEVAQQLIEGYAIESVIPPELAGIRKFRIQVGDEKLVKPDSLLTSNERQDGITLEPATSNGDDENNKDPEVGTGEIDIDGFPVNDDQTKQVQPTIGADPLDFSTPNAKTDDDDAFPLTDQTELDHPRGNTLLIPEQVRPAELPGNAVGSVEDDQDVRIVLEPEGTTLPLLTALQVVDEKPVLEIEPPEITNPTNVVQVVVPVFDKPDSTVVADNAENVEQIAIPALDLLAIHDADSRIVLEALPDLTVASDETKLPVRTAVHEPELLEEDASEFVRLAAATTNNANVVRGKPSPPATSPLPSEQRSWPLFSVTLLGLFISVGGNVYLGMTVLDFYRKRRITSSDATSPRDSDSE